MTAPRRKAVLIAGPTASGKSALALALAERVKGTVLNADSMQVYRDLRILTARPSQEEEVRAPHALYGFVSGEDAYSAGRYVTDARHAIEAAWEAGRIPLVTGGTGLYFRALLEGLSPIPPVPLDIRVFWRKEARRLGAEALHAVLARRDPLTAVRLRPQDTQRLVRALEVLDATGRSLSLWQQRPGAPVLAAGETVKLVIMPERAELARRVALRFLDMMRQGAADEVRALLRRGLDPALPVMRALGVRPLSAWLAGKTSREEAVQAAQAETRQYAKRQITWLRRNMILWTTVKAEDMECMMGEIVAFIRAGD